MCVTSNFAEIADTQTYVYVPESNPSRPARHVCAYQNRAKTFGGATCMFLNFAGNNLAMVHGPEDTKYLMQAVTWRLPELVYVPRMRGGGTRGGGMLGITVEEYGDYTVILSQEPADILDALDQVPTGRRPERTSGLQDMVDFYQSYYPEDSFVLACFDGSVSPEHPITVSYEPRNPDLLVIPGLDGHDGTVPTVGAPVERDFKVAFAIAGVQLPCQVDYREPVAPLWAPSSVTGFVDNRLDGPNGDYVVPVEAVKTGLIGHELAAQLL